MHQSFHIAAIIGFALIISACRQNEAAETTVPDVAAEIVATEAVQTMAPLTPEPSQDTALHSACTDQITAKMPDPSAADVSYDPLSGSDGYEATVALKPRAGGEPMVFTFTCQPTENGGVETKPVAN